MVPERWPRFGSSSIGPLCGRHGIAGADGTRGAGSVEPTAGAVCGACLGGEPRQVQADNTGGRIRVSGF
jgi:hypothetical protein